MQRKKIIFVLFLCFFLNIACVSAATTYKGYSGLINIPSAYVLKSWHGGIGYFHFSGGHSVAGNVSVPGGLEVAFSNLRFDSNKKFDLFSAKMTVLQEKVLKPAVSIGIDDIADKFERNYYIVASKQGPWGMRLHMGLRSGDDIKGLFYGLEKQIRLTNDLMKKRPFIPVLNIMLEYDGQNFNYGAYIRNSQGLRVDVAWHDEKFRFGVQVEF